MCKCAFDKGDKCNALIVRDCEKCSFRKTQEELAEGRAKAKILLERLPEEYRAAIEDKYYGRGKLYHGI